MRRKKNVTVIKGRKKRTARTVIVKWVEEYYLMSADEYDLALAWITIRGTTRSDLPMGRKVGVNDLDSAYFEAAKANAN